jgi:phage-related minor tail protein
VASNKIKGLTVEIGGDTTKLGKALEDVNKRSRELSSELGEINKLLKLDPGNADLLAQKQKVLADAVSNTKEKLDTLKEAEKQVQAQFERGEVSEEQVRALQREIIATEKKLSGYENAVEQTAEEIKKLGKESEDLKDDTDKLGDELKDTKDDLKKTGDEAEETGEDMDKAGDEAKSFGERMKDAGSVAATGLKAVATGVTALVGAMVASAEATRDYRKEMGKLTTAFIDAGHGSEAAETTYKELQGVLGETEQAVEAANHLAKLCETEEDLAAWTNIATGVYATFGASLPIEGLTEAANETAKTGALTGALADALNWAGVSEDDFQAKLDATSTEQERQALITETLNGLYSEAADTYREFNGELIRANQANEEWMAAMAEVGEVVEPILTDVKLLGASLVSDLVPGVRAVAEAFRDVLNGEAGAATDLGEALSGIIDQLLDKVTEMLPAVVEVATSLVMTLADTIISQAPELANKFSLVIRQLARVIAENVPKLATQFVDSLMLIAYQLSFLSTELASAFLSLITGLMNELPAMLQIVAEGLPLLLGELFVEILYTLLPQLMTILSEQLPSLISSWLTILTELIPGLVETFSHMISDILTELLPAITTLLGTTVPQLIAVLVVKLTELLPVLTEAAVTLFMALVDAIPVVIEQLLPVLPSLIETILTALSEALPVMLEAAVTLLMALVSAVPILIDALIPVLPVIIDTITTAVVGALPLLLDAAVQLLMAIVQAIPKFLPDLLRQLPKIISTIISTLLKNLPQLLSCAVDLFMAIVQAIPKIVVELGKQLPSIISAIVKGLGSGVKDLASVGKDLIKDLWNGIKDMTSWITGKLKGFGDSILGGIKDFFGIKSPSRVFRDEVGKMLAEGMAIGIEDNADAPLDAMTDLANGVLDEAGELNGLTLERQLQHTFAAPEEFSLAESGMLSKLDRILAAIERGQVLMLDGKTLVGATAGATDDALGQRRALVARGAI